MMRNAQIAVTELTHDIGGVSTSGRPGESVVDAPDAAPFYLCPADEPERVDDAVRAAVGGLTVWRRSVLPERVGLLHRAADILDARADELAPILCRETGKPLIEARREVGSAARVLRSYAQHASGAVSRVQNSQSRHAWGIELSEPIGVAALITTWNLPLQLAAMKVGAALAAGCAIVVKPSPLAALSIHALVDCLRQAGLPPPVASIVHGGRTTASRLAAHREVAVVSLTGSSAAGRDVMRAAASGPRRCVMELGGKSANIVFEDADLDAAVPGLLAGFVRNQGAVCTAGSRIIVHESVEREVRHRLVAALERLTVGDPYTEVDLGAIRSHSHREFIRREVDEAIAAGATLVTGGDEVSVPGRGGAYLRPMLLSNVKPRDPIWRTELFGPVAVMATFSDDDEAVALADDSDYGLAAGLWSADHRRLERIWRALDVGTVYVNSYHRIDGIPLAAGGRRSSGFGCEGGPAGIAEFLATKSIHFPRTD
jgi:aldehyde dehydrogenase (NAD+)